MGAGAKWTSENISAGPFFVEASLMPGIYAQEDGPDLGGALQFRSAVGAGYEFDNGATLARSVCASFKCKYPIRESGA